MPFNLPGTLVPLHLLVHPRLVLPSLVVKDIRQLDFLALRNAGYRGAVFDKDNCLTRPQRDELVPGLTDAWKECRDAFGEGNVLIVSNSAGTRLDPGGIQAESVTYHLSVPVLRHQVFKPSYACIAAIRSYFASLPKPVKDEELVVVGDRIFTDIVMANRVSRRILSPSLVRSEKVDDASDIPDQDGRSPMRTGPLSVWTSGVWEKESMTMRYLEKTFMQSIQKYVVSDNGLAHTDVERFLKTLPPPDPLSTAHRPGLLKRIWSVVMSRRQE